MMERAVIAHDYTIHTRLLVQLANMFRGKDQKATEFSDLYPFEVDKPERESMTGEELRAMAPPPDQWQYVKRRHDHGQQ